MDEKQDLRTIRTQRHLRDALCELMQLKPINKITIRELTERAEVSRCTFYLYFDSIFSMVQSIENEMLIDYREGIKKIISGNEDSKKLISELITFTFRHKYDNLPYSRILYSSPSHPEFLIQYNNIVIEELRLAFPGKIKADMLPGLNLYLSGILSSIQQWILNDITEPPEEMSKQIIGIIGNGSAYLEMFNLRK
jgi:AcrR family transcriptional regulator